MHKGVSVKLYFWIACAMSIFILGNSFGLFLLVSAIFIIPLIIIHFLAGIKSKNTVNKLLVLSATNLLLFSLVRCDGVHNTSDSGLSALLDIVNINFGFSSEYEKIHHFLSFVFFIFQAILDVSILQKSIYKD